MLAFAAATAVISRLITVPDPSRVLSCVALTAPVIAALAVTPVVCSLVTRVALGINATVVISFDLAGFPYSAIVGRRAISVSIAD